jgi:TP901 family phage tail tape measure protein
LVKKVKELGKTTEFTASQAAEGAITLLKGGNNATQSVEKLDAALAGALATGLDFDKAAKIGTIAWNIFGDNLGKVGKEPKNFATALKTMVAAANASDAEVTELSSSLSRGGNILAGLGLSLTKTTAALGLLANDGVKGERAMTLLSISCKRLVDGTRPAAKALK